MAALVLALLAALAMPTTIEEAIAASSVFGMTVGAACLIPGIRNSSLDLIDGLDNLSDGAEPAEFRWLIRFAAALLLAMAFSLALATAAAYELSAHIPMYAAVPIASATLTALVGAQLLLARTLLLKRARHLAGMDRTNHEGEAA